MTIIELQPIVETQTIIADVNVVDVNVTTRSKVIEEQVFKNKKRRKIKNVIHQEKEKWLKHFMMETFQQIHKM